MRYRFCVLILFLPLHVLLAQPLITHTSLVQDSIPAMEVLEIRVQANASFQNAYDTREVSLLGRFVNPLGDTLLIPGFYLQEYHFLGPDNLIPYGPASWQLRFTPEITGAYHFQLMLLDATGMDTTAWEVFYCTDTLRPGFVRPGNGLFLKHDDGKAFFPIGENMAWSIPEGTYAAYQAWIDSLTAYGGNFIKVMMVPWSISLEWQNTGLGDYSQRQDRARHLDWLLDYCRDKGVYVQLCFLIHDELTSAFNNAWAQNPYNAALGGPCANPIQFFTDTTARRFFLQRLSYIMARWGHHPAILSWEILSEADRVESYGNNKATVTNWLKSISLWLRNHDRHQRMVTAGFASSVNDPYFWADTNTAYTQLHIYTLDPDLEAEVYLTAIDYIQTYNKKYILGEFALSHFPDTIQVHDPDGIAFRNALWTTALSGSMGCGKTWWWDNYIHPNGHYRYFQGVSSLFERYGMLDDSHLPFRPRVLTASHDTLVITPRFLELLAKAPENQFAVEGGGMMFPIDKKLGRYLYSNGFVTAPFRNPPTFHLHFPENGTFLIRTANLAPSPTLSVFIDGLLAWSQVVTANATYSIPVSEGSHQIRVENAGTNNTICEIDEYLFVPCLAGARAFGLRGTGAALGWIQRQDFHWPQWYLNPSPAPLDDAILLLQGFPDTTYTLEWLDAWDGTLISSQVVNSSGDSLLLPIPPFQHDMAFILKPGEVSGIHSQSGKREGFHLQAYPNPSQGELRIALLLLEDTDMRLDILDTAGRVVHLLYQGKLRAGKREWLWDPGQYGLKPGLYIARAMSGNTLRSIKIIIR